MTPDNLLARVLYRDGLILILDKPAGVPVHAGPGGGLTMESLFEHLRFGLPKPPFLAHRLDRDTSGCLVLGRHAKALRKLGQLFSAGKVDKTYWAVVQGAPPADSGLIDQPLKKISSVRGGWRIITAADGQRAETDYRVMGRADGWTWLELKPHTGRTHQIRVHCAAIGCPLLGDPQYGGPAGLPMHLHARAISLPLSANRPPITMTAPVPEHMREKMTACGWGGE